MRDSIKEIKPLIEYLESECIEPIRIEGWCSFDCEVGVLLTVEEVKNILDIIK